MLYFDGIEVSKDIDVNKRSVSKECTICHYWHFLDKSFEFQPDACNLCHVLMISINLSNIDILNICNIDYCYIII